MRIPFLIKRVVISASISKPGELNFSPSSASRVNTLWQVAISVKRTKKSILTAQVTRLDCGKHIDEAHRSEAGMASNPFGIREEMALALRWGKPRHTTHKNGTLSHPMTFVPLG